MRRTSLTVVIGALSLAFIGDRPAQAAKPDITIRVVTPFPAGHILADTAAEFQRRLAEQSDRYTITVTTAVLNEQTIDPAMTSCDPAGRVGDIIITGGQPLQDWAPAYFFFNGPYVIQDYRHFLKVWNSHLGDEARGRTDRSHTDRRRPRN
jgi:TRAP-type C4-dicarboxylate transport system substrate-binding protein